MEQPIREAKLMNKRWMMAGIVAAAVTATAAIGYARGPWVGAGGIMGQGFGQDFGQGYGPGYGMMGGRGMMGQGFGQGFGPGFGPGFGMMGGGACPIAGGQGWSADPGANYNPAAMLQVHEAMLTQQKGFLATLQAQLAAATDDTVKATLTARIERENLMIGSLEAKVQVAKSLPEQWLDGATALARADETYWSAATANEATNKTFITAHLTAAQQQVAWLEAYAQSQQQNSN
jgi:hypothetical protein